MTHAFEIEPLDATFGAVIRGVRLAELDDETWSALHEAWLSTRCSSCPAST